MFKLINFVEYFDTISKPINHVKFKEVCGHTAYMFRPLAWSSSGTCITKGIYMEILQKFLNYWNISMYLCFVIYLPEDGQMSGRNM
jgi:hypothetical protein